MSLDVTVLSSELIKLFDANAAGFVGYPTTKAQVAANWANAYDTYARSAVDTSGDALVTANKAGFITALQSNLPTYTTGTIALGAQAFDLALVAYWTAAIFAIGALPISGSPCPNIGGTTVFSAEISSVVSAVTPSILSGLLLTEFGNITTGTTAQEKADSIAQAFHTATTTAVNVLIIGIDTTPPPAGPLPIMNACYVF
jgi:hypothetical protein